MVEIRKPFDKPQRVQVHFSGNYNVKQSFLDECDINKIIKRYKKDGVCEHFSNVRGIFGDCFDIEDYQSSINKVRQAQDMFDSLPSGIRNRFKNDPAQFLDFVYDPKNVNELISMGLAKPLVESPLLPHEEAIPAKVEAK